MNDTVRGARALLDLHMREVENLARKAEEKAMKSSGSAKKVKKVPKRSRDYRAAAECPQFGRGNMLITPAYFCQGHEVRVGLIDPRHRALTNGSQKPHLKLSQSNKFQYEAADDFILNSRPLQLLGNVVVAVCHPKQYRAGRAAMQKVHRSENMSYECPGGRDGHDWQTCCTGIDAVVNRSTPPHRDHKGRNCFDICVTAGTYDHSIFDLPDLATRLGYPPGTMTLLVSDKLEHECTSWTGGERICFAHWTRAAVLEKMEIEVPEPPTLDDLDLERLEKKERPRRRY